VEEAKAVWSIPGGLISYDGVLGRYFISVMCTPENFCALWFILISLA
jgi:hypothetical protein